MRLDLSKEQIETIINSLDMTIDQLITQKQAKDLQGNARDIVEEVIAVETATVLYLKNFVKKGMVD